MADTDADPSASPDNIPNTNPSTNANNNPISADSTSTSSTLNTPGQPAAVKHSLQFWLVILAMCSASFTSALYTTIITTALPKIT